MPNGIDFNSAEVCEECGHVHDEDYCPRCEEFKVEGDGYSFEPGTIVRGPFWSDGSEGIGVIVCEGRQVWTKVEDKAYVPVKIIVGNRCNGGYRRAKLTAVPELTLR